MSVHKVRYPRYACQKNAHLRQANCAFFDCASLDPELYEPDTYVKVRL